MNLRERVILGAGAAPAPVAGVEAAAVFWASSVLLDVNHDQEDVEKNGFRHWSPRRMFAYRAGITRSRRRLRLLALSRFHTVQWLALVRRAWLRAVAARVLSLVTSGVTPAPRILLARAQPVSG